VTIPVSRARALDELAGALLELVDAAIAARPYVLIESRLENSGLGRPYGNPAVRVLDRLDAAIADAGALLEAAS
jgi:hypothetical protein